MPARRRKKAPGRTRDHLSPARSSCFDHIGRLERVIKAQRSMLAAYRTGDPHGATIAAEELVEARARVLGGVPVLEGLPYSEELYRGRDGR